MYKFIIPTHCPYCGSRLERTPTGKDIICTYEDCEGRQKFRVFNFIQQMCSDVKGIGDSFLESFITGLSDIYGCQIDTLAKFYTACKKAKGQRITTLGNAENIVAEKIIDIILSADIDVEKFFLGLGIRLLGTEAAKKLAKSVAATTNLMSAFFLGNKAKAYSAILSALPGQIALAENVFDAVPAVSNLLSVMPYEELNYICKEEKQTRYYAITGTLSKSRREIQMELSEAGWEMTDNLNKAELLINNDTTSSSSKNVKAKQLNKLILTEDQFRTKYLQ